MCSEGWWCSVDWAIAVGVLQAIAILLTGGLPVWVANRQLSAHNRELAERTKTEKLRLSLKVMDDLVAANPLAADLTLSPLTAISRLSEIMNTKEILHYDNAVADASAGRELSTHESALKNQIHAACVVAVNYFTLVETLLEKHVVDADFVLEKLGLLVRRSLQLVERVNPGGGINGDSLIDLDRRVARFYEAEGRRSTA